MTTFKRTVFGAVALAAASLAGMAQATPSSSPAAPVYDPCAAVAPSELSLEDAVERALCYQPATKELSARLQAARASVGIARSGQRTQLNGSLSVTGSEQPSQDARGTGAAQLRLSRVLLDGGYRQAQVDNAKLTAVALEFDLSAQAQTVWLEATKRFYAVQTAMQKVRTAQDNLKTAQAALDVAQARYQAGDAVKVDVLQAQSSLAEAQLALTQANGSLEVSKVAMMQYAGVPLASTEAVKVKAEALSCQAPALQAVTDLVAQAKADNPALKAAQKRVAAATEALVAASTQNKPNLSWTANLSSQRVNSLPHTNSASVGLTLDVPLFDGGLSKARTAQATAQYAQAQAQLDGVTQALELSVWQARTQVSTAAAACESAQAFAQAASAAASQARGRYEAGAGALLDWLALQSRQTAAQERATSSLADLALARTELNRALGQLTAQ